MDHLVEERYAITYRIHVGRSAAIYLAHDHFLRRSVVLKVLHPSLAADPAHVERFRREACIAAALSHPNLTAVYNLGAYRGTYYIVMEHVTGPSLSTSLQNGVRLPETRALQITAQVAAALAVAHERGVVHRDIRSHHILLAAGGQVKITDFGWAQTVGICAPNPTQATIGERHHQPTAYAPPVPVDGGPDLANLGLVLREMVGGSPRMEAGRTPRRADVLSPSTDAIVRRALATDVALRFPTADAMRAAIDGVLTQITTGPSPSGGPYAIPTWASVHTADNRPRVGLLDLFRSRPTRLAS